MESLCMLGIKAILELLVTLFTCFIAAYGGTLAIMKCRSLHLKRKRLERMQKEKHNDNRSN